MQLTTRSATSGSDSELLSGVRLLNRAVGGRLADARRLLDGERSSLGKIRGRLLGGLDSVDLGSSDLGSGSSGSTGAGSVFYEVFERDRSFDAAETHSPARGPEHFGESLVISDSPGGESMSYEPVSLASWLADNPGTQEAAAGGDHEELGATEGNATAEGGSGETGAEGDSQSGPDSGGGRSQ